MPEAARHSAMSINRYLELPGESASAIKDMITSPLLYRWRRDHGRPDADALRVGRAAHTAVFEPHLFAEGYVVWRGKVRRGHKWDAFRVEHQRRTILTPPQYETALQIGGAVRSHPIARALLDDQGEAELAITWTHQRTGLACKARLDWLCSALVDLKTTRDPSPAMFASQVARLGYHVQLAVYGAAVAALGMESRRPKLIAVQNVPPHDVVVYDVPDDVLVIGEQKAESALDLIASCRDAGAWPGIARYEELTLRLPAWATPYFDDELEVSVTEVA